MGNKSAAIAVYCNKEVEFPGVSVFLFTGFREDTNAIELRKTFCDLVIKNIQTHGVGARCQNNGIHVDFGTSFADAQREIAEKYGGECLLFQSNGTVWVEAGLEDS